MRLRSATLMFSLLVCLLLVATVATRGPCQQTGPPEAIDTSQPVYGEMALPLTGENTLYLSLQASRNGGPRDLLYIDRNRNDQFEDNECSRANTTEPKGSPVLHMVFPSATLNVPQGDNEPRLGCTLTVRSMFQPNTGRPELFTWFLSFALGDRKQQWTYDLVGVLQTSPDAQKPPLSGLSGDLQMEVDARPDTKQAGNTGVGVSLKWGSSLLTGHLGQAGLPVHVTLLNQNGMALMNSTTDSSKAAFG